MKGKLLLCTIVVGGAALLWFWPGSTAAASTLAARDLYTVRRADLNIALTEKGTMDPRLLYESPSCVL